MDPGTWHATLEIGTSANPVILADCFVKVAADSLTSVVLEERGVSAPARARLAGTLEMSVEWGAAGSLMIAPTGDTAAWCNAVDEEWSARDAAPAVVALDQDALRAHGRVHWDMGEQCVGSWEFALAEIGWSVRLTLGAYDAGAVRLVVPPPCRLRVRFIESSTGQLVRFDESNAVPRWAMSAPTSYRGRFTREDGDVYSCLVPEERITVELPLSYVPVEASATIDVQRSDNVLDVQVERTGGVLVRVTDENGDLCPVDGGLVQPSGGDATYWTSPEPECTKIAARVFGTLRLRLDCGEDVEAVQDRTVVVVPGEWLPIAIKTRRRTGR
jgi:hypothetical protein